MTIPTASSDSLPTAFRTRIVNLYGQEGYNWLENLPVLLQSLRERWNLGKPQQFPHLSYNYLEFAHSPEFGPIVLKIGFPNPELDTEIQTLTLYKGLDAAVQLLDHDSDHGALLLDRIIPGRDLNSFHDEEEGTRVAARTMQKLRHPAPQSGTFPSIGDWCQGFSRYLHTFPHGSGPIPAQLINRTSRLAEELVGETQQLELLHGDLHHGNLLSRKDGSWIAIDPKGVIGNFAAEVGPYLFNPIPDLIQQPNLENLLDRRLRIFEEMIGLDRQELMAWSLVRVVLAGIWTVEENTEEPDYFVKIAEILGKLK